MKKLLFLLTADFDQDNIDSFNERMDMFKKRCTSDFQRRGRKLELLGRWKATEFRLFLLYAGPIVLKGLVTEEKLNHFLKLHTALTLLLSPSIDSQQTELARVLLKDFVLQMSEIYGEENLIFNVHSIIHLPDDCDYFEAPLDVFACFVFESKLGHLINELRGRRHPVAQIKGRISERRNFPGVQRSKYLDPSATGVSSLKVGSDVNSYLMMNEGVVIKVLLL